MTGTAYLWGCISVKCHVDVDVRLKAGLLHERSPSMRLLMNGICIALSGFKLLSPNIVLSVLCVRAAAAKVQTWEGE